MVSRPKTLGSSWQGRWTVLSFFGKFKMSLFVLFPLMVSENLVKRPFLLCVNEIVTLVEEFKRPL